MRGGRRLLVVVLAWSPAYAQEPDAPPPSTAVHESYPTALPDRPLVLPCGATELEISEELYTYVQSMTDMNGNMTRERIGFADDYNLDIRASHAFRNVEVMAFLDQRAGATVSIDTFTIPSTISVGAAFTGPQKDDRYNHSQFAAASHKLVLVPGRFSISGGARVSVTETRGIVDMMDVEGGIVRAGAGATGYVQLGWRFAAQGGASFSAPLWQTDGFEAKATLEVSAFLLVALRRWDFYVGGALGDITRSEPSTYFTFGFKKRWGV